MWQHVVSSATLIHPRGRVTAEPCVCNPAQIYRTIRRYIPEECELHRHCHQHLHSQPDECQHYFPTYN